jgi:hypothetical protein
MKLPQRIATPLGVAAITVESAKKYKSHKKRVYFNLIKSNDANNGLPLFVHFLQESL